MTTVPVGTEFGVFDPLMEEVGFGLWPTTGDLDFGKLAFAPLP
jgi:hypothetical protein